MDSGAALDATAGPSWAAVQAGAPAAALDEGSAPSVAPVPEPVLAPSLSSSFLSPLSVPSTRSEAPPAVLSPPSGSLPWPVPPCACEAWPTAEGLASEPEPVAMPDHLLGRG